MRIIAGSAKGRKISRPKTADTRPMMDSTREAIFNILGPIDGLRIADLYAGSGALSLEALSRGAAMAVAVENDKSVAEVIRQNAEGLGFGPNLRLEVKTVGEWLGHNTEQFDIIFFLPPYAAFDAKILSYVPERLSPNGLLIIALSRRQDPGRIDGLKQLSQRKYGQSVVSFYQKKG